MDDDLDDLFGEAPSLQLPPLPLPKGLLQRVDDLCANGCRQKVAWSRIGCLAYLSNDSRLVILQNLVCDPQSGQWTLSKQYEIDDIRSTHGDTDLVHLCWSHSGYEIAVIDNVGRISIHMILLAVNRLTCLRRAVQDPEDDLTSPVGFMWLNTENPLKQDIFHKSMVRTDNVWNFSRTPQRAAGPHAPKDRPGWVSVSRMGILRALFQQADRWVEVKAMLGEIGLPMELLTHAAICPDKSQDKKNSLYVVTFNSQQAMRLYKVKINFEPPKIHVHVLKTITIFGPIQRTIEGESAEQDRLLASARLSFLDLVPAGADSKGRVPSLPFILAGFSYLTDDFQAGSEQSTVICKFEISAGKPILHPSFDHLSAKKASSRTELMNECLLRRADDTFVPKTLLTTQQINVSSVLAMIYSDGSVDFRDRDTMQILSPDENEDRISSLHQIGFNFLGARPCLHATLSPNTTTLFVLDEQHAPTLNVMQYLKLVSPDAMNENFFERICEGFVLQCAYACLNHWNYTDDFLCTLQYFSNQYLRDGLPEGVYMGLSDRNAFKAYLLSETYRILGIKIDHSMDELPDPGFKSPFFQRGLNTQSALGFSGNEVLRPLPSLIAWSMLQSRYCAMVFATACNTNKNPSAKAPPGAAENEARNPETVHFLLGLVKWYMDLISYIVGEMFALSNFFEEKGGLENLTAATLNQHLIETNSSALFLVLISTSRAILRFDCRLMRLLTSESTKIHEPQTALGRAYREFDYIHAKAHIDLTKAQDLFSTIDSLIKTAYRNAGFPDTASAERSAAERDMLIKGEIPEVLIGVVREILGTIVQGLGEELNVAELFFADVSWLGLTKKVAKIKRRARIDDMRKVELSRDAKVRRCTRCCALMEDQMPGRGVTLVMGLQRDCFCGAKWMLLDGTEDANGQI